MQIIHHCSYRSGWHFGLPCRHQCMCARNNCALLLSLTLCHHNNIPNAFPLILQIWFKNRRAKARRLQIGSAHPPKQPPTEGVKTAKKIQSRRNKETRLPLTIIPQSDQNAEIGQAFNNVSQTDINAMLNDVPGL